MTKTPSSKKAPTKKTPTKKTLSETEYASHLKDIEAALESDHCDPCGGSCEGCPNTCDIHAAYDHGFYLWAAHILSGATECPKTDLAVARLQLRLPKGEYEAKLKHEGYEFLRTVRSLKCDGPKGCGSHVYTEDDLVTCGNCHATVKSEYQLNKEAEETAEQEPEETYYIVTIRETVLTHFRVPGTSKADARHNFETDAELVEEIDTTTREEDKAIDSIKWDPKNTGPEPKED